MSRIFSIPQTSAAEDLIERVQGPFSTILADPPWRFENRTGKMGTRTPAFVALSHDDNGGDF